MVPALANQSLLIGGKFSEAGYVSICDGNGVNISDGYTAKIIVSEPAVLKGWRCPKIKLWCVFLQANITNLNTDTIVLNGSTGHESLNSAYVVPPTAKMRAHLALSATNPASPPAAEAIQNGYELPSIKSSVRCLHAAAGFPTNHSHVES